MAANPTKETPITPLGVEEATELSCVAVGGSAVRRLVCPAIPFLNAVATEQP